MYDIAVRVKADMTTWEDIVQRLETWRGDRTLRDFAEELGVQHQNLFAILQHKRRPSKAVLDKLGEHERSGHKYIPVTFYRLVEN